MPLSSSEDGRSRCRELYGDYVLFPGDLRPGGGVDSALAAAQHFPKGLNLVLACRPKTAADNERKRRIEEQIKAMSDRRVFLLGQIDWIGDLVSAARAQLLPATDLTGKMDWPLVILEGFAAGVPAVTAQDSPMADLVEPSLGVADAVVLHLLRGILVLEELAVVVAGPGELAPERARVEGGVSGANLQGGTPEGDAAGGRAGTKSGAFARFLPGGQECAPEDYELLGLKVEPPPSSAMIRVALYAGKNDRIQSGNGRHVRSPNGSKNISPSRRRMPTGKPKMRKPR